MANKNNWVVIEGRRYNLASMVELWRGHDEYGTGIYLQGVFLMPRKKQVIVETYSIWENPRTHGCYGTSYRIADDIEVAKLAEELRDIRLMALVPEGDI